MTKQSFPRALRALIFLAGSVIALAQQPTAFIAGRVLSAGSGAVVSGVAVSVPGGGPATITDLNGLFRLDRLPAGSQELMLSKAGFQPLTVTGVSTVDGEAEKLDVVLTPTDGGIVRLENFSVSAAVLLNSGSGLLVERQKAVAVSDSIGSDQMSRLGFNDAAQAMKAVTGASVVDGKYVYIRGLGDRYSSTSLNGAEVPSADPDRRAVQMDLFPTFADLTWCVLGGF